MKQIEEHKKQTLSKNLALTELKISVTEEKALNEKYKNKINELLRYQLLRAQQDLSLQP